MNRISDIVFFKAKKPIDNCIAYCKVVLDDKYIIHGIKIHKGLEYFVVLPPPSVSGFSIGFEYFREKICSEVLEEYKKQQLVVKW